MNRTEYLFAALKSYSENLGDIDYTQKDKLFFLLKSYLLDYLKGKRASFLKYEKTKHLLYNNRTLVYKNGSPELIEIDIEEKLRHITIPLETDVRNIFLKDKRLQIFSNTQKIKNFSNVIDKELQINASHVLIYPILFKEEFLGIIELTRDDLKNPFDEIEKVFVETIMNFTNTIVHNIYLYEWAIKDSLTDCYANTFLEKKIDEFIITQKRYDYSFSLMKLDLDSFHQVNKKYGHLVGDDALIYFSDVIKRFIRLENDIIARYGGDQFCVLLKHCDKKKSLVVANRILNHLKKNPFKYKNKEVLLSAGIGIAEFNVHAHDKATLLDCADQALKQSKRKDSGQSTIFSA